MFCVLLALARMVALAAGLGFAGGGVFFVIGHIKRLVMKVINIALLTKFGLKILKHKHA
jgi:hypothetical protein